MFNKSVTIPTIYEVLSEAEEVLFKNLGIEKTALFFTISGKGSGNYIELKEKLFEGETGESFYEKVKSFEG